MTIIGVIAALTIPTLMKNMQEHAWHQQWKDNYALINNVFKLVAAETPDMIISKERSYYMTPEFIQAMTSHLKYEDSCGDSEYDDTPCDPKKNKWVNIDTKNNTSTIKTLTGNVIYRPYEYNNKVIIMKNGSTVYFGGYVSSLTILIDVNNGKGPNTLGKDIYAITLKDRKWTRIGNAHYYNQYINDYELLPYGENIGTAGCSTAETDGSLQHFWKLTGVGCSYKYLYEK